MDDVEDEVLLSREDYARGELGWTSKDYVCPVCLETYGPGAAACRDWPLYLAPDGSARCDAHAPRLPQWCIHCDALANHSSESCPLPIVAG